MKQQISTKPRLNMCSKIIGAVWISLYCLNLNANWELKCSLAGQSDRCLLEWLRVVETARILDARTMGPLGVDGLGASRDCRRALANTRMVVTEREATLVDLVGGFGAAGGSLLSVWLRSVTIVIFTGPWPSLLHSAVVISCSSRWLKYVPKNLIQNLIAKLCFKTPLNDYHC